MIKINVDVGDVVLVGRFKNKRVTVKEIGVDGHGMPTINGRTVVNFRKAAPKTEGRKKMRSILRTMSKK